MNVFHLNFIVPQDLSFEKMASHERPSGHKFCLDHLDEELTIICKTCGIPLCTECLALAEHAGHSFESINKRPMGLNALT